MFCVTTQSTTTTTKKIKGVTTSLSFFFVYNCWFVLLFIFVHFFRAPV